MDFALTTTAFSPGGDIPKALTCDGPDLSPPLAWSDPPDKTASFALICDDPDAPAGTWVHWVLYDLPATARSLSESVPRKERLEDGSVQGKNDFGRIGYGGPCPPRGTPHRYFFRLYALDVRTGLPPGATKAEVETAMRGHVLGQAKLMGRYGR